MAEDRAVKHWEDASTGEISVARNGPNRRSAMDNENNGSCRVADQRGT